MGVGETFNYVILAPPVNEGNLTVGYFRYSGSAATQQPPSGAIPDAVTLPVHVKVTDPAGQTLIDQDIVTPTSLVVNFGMRGDYNVYLTNQGSEQSPIPVGVQFQRDNLQNREADKFLFGEVFTILGGLLILIGLAVNIASKKRKPTK
ncbi:MAG: hypothetical protein NWF01_07135 [Candidatus Bathyarchaeota archaeon]|nr:hypothetical protein [Candidatus Bathyarchaeota archaeon]